MKQTGKHLVIAACILLSIGGCGGRRQKNSEQAAKPVFPKTEIPAMMTDPQMRAEYLIDHYWRTFDFTDTTFLAQPEVLEQALVDYIVLLPYAGTDRAARSLTALMESARADTAMHRFFMQKTEHYLWDPNSPYHNDEFYLPVLESALASGLLDQAARARAEYRLGLARKNRPGTPAADFSYTTVSGQTGKMSQIRSEYLLLFFNNPGCAACAEIIAHADASPLLNALQEEKKDGVPRLRILALYPDEDLSEWEKYLPRMPSHWIVSYDKTHAIKDGNLYDLKAIPTLYLLDADRNVILKDADIRLVEKYLQQQVVR